MDTPFLEPKLEGGRFDNHTIPLEVLKDWAAFEELVVEVAREIFLKENPERRKAPNGFGDGFSLHLVGIGPGSAIPYIHSVTPDNPKVERLDLFQRARDVVLAAVASAAIATTPITAATLGNFPAGLTGYFDRFGRSLQGDERIALIIPGSSAPAVIYNTDVRKRLVLFKATEYRQNADLRGTMLEVHVEKLSFIIRLNNGLVVSGAFTEELRKIAAEALIEYGSSPVLVKGTAVFDRNDKLKKIEEVSHIEILDPNDVPTRMEILSYLQDGWLDGEGRALPASGVKWFTDAWLKNFPNNLPLPYIYPSEGGGIQAEWSLKPWEISIQIDLNSKRANLLAFDTTNPDTGVEREINLDQPAEWEWIGKTVAEHVAPNA